MKTDIFTDSAPSFSSATPTRLGQPTEAELASRYYPLVGQVVNRMRTNLPPSADLEELHSIGVYGLMSAIRRYDVEQDATFRGYAAMRIRGAILDELRKMDTLPRTRRAKVREMNKVLEKLEQELGRAPKDEEMAKEMGLSTGDFHKLREQIKPKTIISLDCGGNGDETDDPSLHDAIADERHVPCHEKMESRETFSILGQQIETLPERQRQVISMYYFDEMRLAEIAEVFGVTEARICQIHTQAVGQLKKKLVQAAA
ncbi:FliA/WhiG family RNA polymerase sigma factor [Rubellicoccus peritrichatus]|uniref:FliA/WhiG family RNA polymerase sigma factor n=1 Tax=Rubellicoccus peritrichatus TaxID=3080537 RepID=A0AAQ3LBU8_9BACT|nr:FliA/WhiG family RNA polymerase sigma factor [Puniceicoccus sp. CR14]WOO42891.1 FliA/WhiG family RNA polymerase sigma factor [Puniceicoccus sp. CR14]